VDTFCPAWTQNVPTLVITPENGLAAAFFRKTAAAQKKYFYVF
jgi:hypothetical protein